MAITPLEKDLAAVGVSVAAGCKPCTKYHVKAARQTGASDLDMEHLVNAAVAIRTSANDIMKNCAFAQIRVSGESGHFHPISGMSRLDTLIGMGDAFAANWTTRAC